MLAKTDAWKELSEGRDPVPLVLSSFSFIYWCLVSILLGDSIMPAAPYFSKRNLLRSSLLFQEITRHPPSQDLTRDNHGCQLRPFAAHVFSWLIARITDMTSHPSLNMGVELMPAPTSPRSFGPYTGSHHDLFTPIDTL
jgi:hypothetical protein